MLRPDYLNPAGDDVLNDVLNDLYDHWRSGKQIAMLVGAGLSIECGYPALSPLAEHLLTLLFLKSQSLTLDPAGKVDAYSPLRDGWLSPAIRMERLLPRSASEAISEFLVQRWRSFHPYSGPIPDGGLGKRLKAFVDQLPAIDVTRFAREVLGLSWIELLWQMADEQPHLVEALFDTLGARVRPGGVYALLAQCVDLLNINLILTTNFDTLIEDTLVAEGLKPYVYDVHIAASPPPPELVRRHLAVVKMHGSRYGLRADRSVNASLDPGHLQQLTRYFDDQALLLVLGYGGNDKRVMDLLGALLDQGTLPRVRRIVRLDMVSPVPDHPFYKLAREAKRGASIKDQLVYNLLYPDTGLFLSEAYQFCAESMPNSRTVRIALPLLPAPHWDNRLGHDALHRKDAPQQPGKPAPDPTAATTAQDPAFPVPVPAASNRAQSQQAGDAVWLWADQVADLIGAIRAPAADHGSLKDGQTDASRPPRVAIVAGRPGSGVSQFLAEVYERLRMDYDAQSYELEEAFSVGTLVTWIYEFVSRRQPDLPAVPPPLDLPPRDSGQVGASDVVSLRRTARALWTRLARGKFLVMIDSLSEALTGIYRLRANDRPQPEAAFDDKLMQSNKGLWEALDGWCRTIDECLTQEAGRLQTEAQRLLLLLAWLTYFATAEERPTQTVFVIGTHARDPRGDKDTSDLPVGVRRSLSMHLNDIREKCGRAIQEDTKLSLDEKNSMLRIVYLLAAHPCAGAYATAWEDWAVEFRNEVAFQGGELDLSAGPTKDVRSVPIAASGRPIRYESLDSRGNLYRYDTGEYDPAAKGAKLKDDADLWRFLTQCALAARPRSWVQMAQMPSIRPDRRESIERVKNPRDTMLVLVQRCLDQKLLHRQPGGFFWIDGDLKEYIRQNTDLSNDDIRKDIRRSHVRFKRYYERLFTQSGDTTSLNEYFYHSMRLIEDDLYDTSVYKLPIDSFEEEFRNKLSRLWEIFESTCRNLAENAGLMRGHTGVYDHTLFLLRLGDVYKACSYKLSPAGGDTPETQDELLGKLKNALAEFYEDAHVTTVDLRAEELEYQCLRLPYRHLDLALTYGAAMLTLEGSLPALKDKLAAEAKKQCDILRTSLRTSTQGKQGSQRAGVSASTADLKRVQAARDVLERVLAWFSVSWGQRLLKHPGPAGKLHRCLFRLAHICTEEVFLASTQPDSDPPPDGDPPSVIMRREWLSHVNSMLSAGMRILDLDVGGESDEYKGFWCRYRTNLARCILAMTEVKEKNKEADASTNRARMYNNLSLAHAYATRSRSPDSDFANAIVSLYEAEALIWEARFLLATYKKPTSGKAAEPPFGEAQARLLAAERELSSSASMLTECRRDLSWWRIYAILYACLSADRLKCLAWQLTDCWDGLRSIDHAQDGGCLVRSSADLPQGGNADRVAGAADADSDGVRHRPVERRMSTDSERSDNPALQKLRELKELWIKAAQIGETAARELDVISAIIWDDPWRESKLEFERRRIRFYVTGLLYQCLGYTSQNGTLDTVGEHLTTAVAGMLRALSILDDKQDLLLLQPGVSADAAGLQARVVQEMRPDRWPEWDASGMGDGNAFQDSRACMKRAADGAKDCLADLFKGDTRLWRDRVQTWPTQVGADHF